MNLVDRRARPAQDALLTIAPERSGADARRGAAARRCRRGTTCGAADVEREAAGRRAGTRARARACAISPRFCCSNSSVRARCSRSRWSPKSCTARRRDSTTRRGSRLRTAARTATRFLCRCASTTNRSPSCAARSTPQTWALDKLQGWHGSTRSPARSTAPAPRGRRRGRHRARARDLAVARRTHGLRRPGRTDASAAVHQARQLDLVWLPTSPRCQAYGQR